MKEKKKISYETSALLCVKVDKNDKPFKKLINRKTKKNIRKLHNWRKRFIALVSAPWFRQFGDCICLELAYLFWFSCRTKKKANHVDCQLWNYHSNNIKKIIRTKNLIAKSAMWKNEFFPYDLQINKNFPLVMTFILKQHNLDKKNTKNIPKKISY